MRISQKGSVRLGRRWQAIWGLSEWKRKQNLRPLRRIAGSANKTMVRNESWPSPLKKVTFLSGLGDRTEKPDFLMKTRRTKAIWIAMLAIPWTIFAGCSSDNQPSSSEPPAELSLPAGTNAPASVASEHTIPIQKIEPTPMVTSAGIDDIIKLVKSGVQDSVVLAYIESSDVAYDPSVEEILYLNDIGISSEVVSAMLRRGRQVRDQMAEKQQAAVEMVAEPVPSAPAVPATPEVEPSPASAAPPAAPAEQVVVDANPATAPTAAVQPQVVYQAPATMPQTVQVFYQTLSPYGSWIELDGYGWCWQPTVLSVNAAWTPYSDGGRWIYTDCGWYWTSDYSWGWAPFHYGRWFRHGHCGWVWAPGDVWGPAWVSWRYWPGYCGWAPLPPGAYWHHHSGWSYYGTSVGISFGFGLAYADFTFVHAKHFGSRDWHHHRASHDNVKRFYNNSVVINNYVKGDNNVIINNGIGNERLRPFRGADPKPIAVRDAPQGAGQIIKPDRIENRNGKEVVFRRQLQESIPQKPNISTADNQRRGPSMPGQSTMGNSRSEAGSQFAAAGNPGGLRSPATSVDSTASMNGRRPEASSSFAGSSGSLGGTGTASVSRSQQEGSARSATQQGAPGNTRRESLSTLSERTVNPSALNASRPTAGGGAAPSGNTTPRSRQETVSTSRSPGNAVAPSSAGGTSPGTIAPTTRPSTVLGAPNSRTTAGSSLFTRRQQAERSIQSQGSRSGTSVPSASNPNVNSQFSTRAPSASQAPAQANPGYNRFTPPSTYNQPATTPNPPNYRSQPMNVPTFNRPAQIETPRPSVAPTVPRSAPATQFSPPSPSYTRPESPSVSRSQTFSPPASRSYEAPSSAFRSAPSSTGSSQSSSSSRNESSSSSGSSSRGGGRPFGR